MNDQNKVRHDPPAIAPMGDGMHRGSGRMPWQLDRTSRRRLATDPHGRPPSGTGLDADAVHAY